MQLLMLKCWAVTNYYEKQNKENLHQNDSNLHDNLQLTWLYELPYNHVISV